MKTTRENSNINLEKLWDSFEAIENPKTAYKTAFEIQKSEYTSIIAGLLLLVALQIALTGIDYVYVLGTSILAVIVGLVNVLHFGRGLIFFMSAESDRRVNGLLFANSVLLDPSEDALSNYRDYNIRISKTHNSGPYFLHLAVLLLTSILLIIQFNLSQYLNLDPSSMHLFFEPLSSVVPSVFIFLIAMVLLSGLTGCLLRMFSDVMVSKWIKVPDSEIRIHAKKLKSNKYLSPYFNLEMTFEDAVELRDDAEKGIQSALDSAQSASNVIDRQYIRFKKVRLLYIITMVIISIIDIILLYG